MVHNKERFWFHEYLATKRNTPHLRERQLFLGCVMFFVGLNCLLFGYGPWGESYQTLQGHWAGVLAAGNWTLDPLIVAQPRKSDMEYGYLAIWEISHLVECFACAYFVSPVWLIIWVEEIIMTGLVIVTQKQYNYIVLKPRTTVKKK